MRRTLFSLLVFTCVFASNFGVARVIRATVNCTCVGPCTQIDGSTTVPPHFTAETVGGCAGTCAGNGCATYTCSGATCPSAGGATTGGGFTEQETTKRGLGGAKDLFTTYTAPHAGFAPTDQQPEVVAGNIIKGLMALIGVIFGILIIYGGFLWMIARGNEENVKKSIDIIQAAVIGFIVTVAAYAITNYVVSQIISAAFQ